MKQKHSVSVVCYTIAGLAALITIFPLYWTLITSFKTYKEAFAGIYVCSPCARRNALFGRRFAVSRWPLPHFLRAFCLRNTGLVWPRVLIEL